MNEDGPSVPKTPPSTKPAPVLEPWFDATKTLVERAVALRELPLARGRVGVFQTLIYELNESGADKTVAVADLFEAAFEDRSGAKFWRARLSLMTDRGEFIAMLLPHLTAENRNRSLNQLLLDDLVSKDLPASGLLRDGRFNPRPVVEWISEREGYYDMLPTSLHAFLKSPDDQGSVIEPPERPLEPQRTGAPGRPTSMHLILAERDARARRGETLRSKKEEAQVLHAWFKRMHPLLASPTELTIRNRLSKKIQ